MLSTGSSGDDRVKEKEAADGSFKLIYLTDPDGKFELELTWLRDKKEPYNLGDNESHLAFRTDDYAASHALHEKWVASAMKIPAWASTLSMIPITIGSRLFPHVK